MHHSTNDVSLRRSTLPSLALQIGFPPEQKAHLNMPREYRNLGILYYQYWASTKEAGSDECVIAHRMRIHRQAMILAFIRSSVYARPTSSFAELPYQCTSGRDEDLYLLAHPDDNTCVLLRAKSQFTFATYATASTLSSSSRFSRSATSVVLRSSHRMPNAAPTNTKHTTIIVILPFFQ